MPIIERNVDSSSGLITDVGFEDGKMHIRYTQDVEAAREVSQALRNDDEYTANGIKNDLVRVVHLTEIDCMKLITEDGINPYTCHASELKRHLYRNKEKWGHVFVTRGNF